MIRSSAILLLVFVVVVKGRVDSNVSIHLDEQKYQFVLPTEYVQFGNNYAYPYVLGQHVDVNGDGLIDFVVGHKLNSNTPVKAVFINDGCNWVPVNNFNNYCTTAVTTSKLEILNLKEASVFLRIPVDVLISEVKADRLRGFTSDRNDPDSWRFHKSSLTKLAGSD